MIDPEGIKLFGNILFGASVFALVLWAAATMGFWPDLRDKQASSSWEMHKKYSPQWWQKFSRWFLVIALVFGVIGFFLSGPHPRRESSPSLLQQLFGRDK